MLFACSPHIVLVQCGGNHRAAQRSDEVLLGGNQFLLVFFHAADVAAARSGNTELLDKKWKAMDDRQAFNQGWASIRLALDANSQIQQVNMFVPGYSCTVAIIERDLRNFAQEYKFDGKRIRLKSKGSYLCDMKAQGLGTPKFGWDVNLTTTVFAKAPRAK